MTTANARPATLPIVLMMGVSGCGKSAVGRRLAFALRVPFVDADDLHPVANLRKMTAGEPLTDADRAPWLEAVGQTMAAALMCGRGVVVACSALKRAYRDRLRRPVPTLRLVWLTGPGSVIEARLTARADHFMPPALLKSQLETLEPPTPDERPIVADISPPPEEIAAWVAARLGVTSRGE